MKIPYVIDNQTNRLADVLNGLLTEHAGRSGDVATAYFTVQGFRLLKDGLDRIGTFRLSACLWINNRYVQWMVEGNDCRQLRDPSSRSGRSSIPEVS